MNLFKEAMGQYNDFSERLRKLVSIRVGRSLVSKLLNDIEERNFEKLIQTITKMNKLHVKMKKWKDKERKIPYVSVSFFRDLIAHISNVKEEDWRGSVKLLGSMMSDQRRRRQEMYEA